MSNSNSPFRRLMDLRRARTGVAYFGVSPMSTPETPRLRNPERHAPGGDGLARAIRTARYELRHGAHSMVSYRMELGNLALHRKGMPMRAWTYEQVCGPHHSVCLQVGLRKVDAARAQKCAFA